MGVFPMVFLKPMEASVTRVVDRLANVRTLRVENIPTPPAVKVAR